jgi:hypothetical protein
LDFLFASIIVNVFAGIQNNFLFCSILLITSVLQVLIVQFGSVAFSVADDGLDGKFWGLSLILGFGSLPVQQVINVLYTFGLNHRGLRNQKRMTKGRTQTTQSYNDSKTSLVEQPEHEALNEQPIAH